MVVLVRLGAVEVTTGVGVKVLVAGGAPLKRSASLVLRRWSL